jgi:GDP-4-dehydro-6-deoxy-D-mannose reductase
MRKSILITGAGGFTGLHACRYFRQAGFEVIAVTRSKHPDSFYVKEYPCDLTDASAVATLIQAVQPQYLLHLAGQNHVGKSWEEPLTSMENNAFATLYLLEALRKFCPGCKSIIVGSALQFDLNDMTSLKHPYALSKTSQVLFAQAWAQLYQLPIIIASPSNLIGPGHSTGVCSLLAAQIIASEHCEQITLHVPNSLVRRDFLDVRDAVRAYAILLEKGVYGESYEVRSGHSKSLEEIINCFQTLVKTNIEVVTDKQEESFIEILPTKLNQLLWEPTIPLQDSLSDILSYHRNQNLKK